jgi:hypothetical protein
MRASLMIEVGVGGAYLRQSHSRRSCGSQLLLLFSTDRETGPLPSPGIEYSTAPEI